MNRLYLVKRKWTKRPKSVRGQDYEDTTKELDQISEAIKAIYKDHEYGNISVANFKALIPKYMVNGNTKPPKRSDTLFKFIEGFIHDRNQSPDAKRGTNKVLLTCFIHLKTFRDSSYWTKSTLHFSDIDEDFLRHFKRYFYGLDLSSNYASKMIEVIRQFMNAATRKGLTTLAD